MGRIWTLHGRECRNPVNCLVGLLYDREVSHYLFHHNSSTPISLPVINTRFYRIALGRPSVCNERDISTPLPTALPEVEFQTSTLCSDQESSTMSYSVTNFRHTCEMLRLTAAPLDEMYVSQNYNACSGIVRMAKSIVATRKTQSLSLQISWILPSRHLLRYLPFTIGFQA